MEPSNELTQQRKDLLMSLAKLVEEDKIEKLSWLLNDITTADPFWNPSEIRQKHDATASMRLMDALCAYLGGCLSDDLTRSQNGSADRYSGEAFDEIVNRMHDIQKNGRFVLLYKSKRAIQLDKPREAISFLQKSMAIFYDDLLAQSLLVKAYGMLSTTERPSEIEQASKSLHGRFCHKPFMHFETTPNGDVYVCCPSFLPVPIGNINNGSNFMEIWNSPTAKELRKSILDGDFRYCSRISCPAIQANSLPLLNSNVEKEGLSSINQSIEKKETFLERGPRFVNLSHDRSCNLSCPSCRTKVIVANKIEQDQFDKTLESIFLPMLKQASNVWITGSGDPFASKHYRGILSSLNRQEYKDLTVDLQTNGQLFTPSAWANLENIHDMIGHVSVSIDAAEADTYADVRRGGTFDRLVQNMELLASLRRAEVIKRLTIAFVLQAQNIGEAKKFVELGKRWSVDQIIFSRIRQWGTYSEEEFLRRNIFNPDNPLHSKLAEVLSDPVFDDSIVWLGNISQFRKA
jgi:MoaA/NifB/PqqE/SkfB family radical SAM enzyme